ncbi:MAG: hypothetical protein HC941_32420, partial [Microcoleus sp. SU_5_3]|nr:hypothetical protein [Microcoleus sp. SU_5_3]
TFAPKFLCNWLHPKGVSIGDIDGDGKPDLAVANSNFASILLNTTPTGATTPTFAPKVDFTTQFTADSISIGDLNADGKPDLAVSNVLASGLFILLNSTPKVTAVTATTPDGSYGVGATIAITVTFNVVVNVTGTPRLQLETGTTDQFANYASGSGTTALTFNYVVQAGDTSADLEYLATNALTLNGGTIKDSATLDDAILTLPALASANSLGGSKAIVINNVIDNVAPTITSVTSTTANGSYNTTGNINVTVNFSEAVTLAGGNMTVALDTGGTVTLAPFTGTSAIGTYTPGTGQNSTDLNSTGITLAVGATLKDAAGNNATLTIPAGQSLADSKAIIVDTVAPTVALTSTSPPTVTGLFSVTATFNEDVVGFDNTDLTAANATVSNFVKVDAKTYTFDVTPTASGNVTVDIPAAKATDAAGNNNTAATQLTRTANITPIDDITPPNVVLTSTSPTTVTGLFNVTATFNEDVTGFDNTDPTVANATVSNFVKVDAKIYTFDVTPTADGNVTVDIPAAKATDTAGNNNTAATQLTRTANITTPPVVDVTPPNANLAAIASITTAGGTNQTLTVTFTDDSGVDVSSFDNSDLVVNWSGGTIPATFISFTPTGNSTPRTATYSLTPPGGTWDNSDNGNYTVNLQAPQVRDIVGNFAIASNLGNFSVEIATPTPTPSVTPNPTPSVTPEPTPSVTPNPTPTSADTEAPPPLDTPPLQMPNDDCICDNISYPNLNQPNEVENTILGVSNIQIGTAKNDEFLGSNSGNIFDARSGDDNLYGGDSGDIFNGNTGNDLISGGSGDDVLFGDENNDIILGNLGNDIIFGGKNNDSINGGEDDDIVYGNINDDFIDGGKGNDTLFGGKGGDVLLGSEGEDSLFGSRGDDTICGGAGNDFIRGNEQSDILGGCAGNDTIDGGEDNDTLSGSQGEDILYGDFGNDSLIGGSGNDIFVLEAGRGFDIIADFTLGQDSIALTGSLSFGQLEIVQNSQGALIRNILTGEELSLIIGVRANLITSANFQII